MGYRTTIKNINSIGHLIEGNVYTFFQQSISSMEMFNTNINFLDRLITKTSEQFYMSTEYWGILDRDIRYLRRDWDRIKYEWKDIINNWDGNNSLNPQNLNIEPNENLLEYLRIISQMFSRCKVKSILLPGFENDNPINRFLTSEATLEKIVKIHPGETALILQFEEQFTTNEKSILNVFPNFDKALHQIDNWPGIFLWTKDDSLFLPIRYEEEVFEIFRIIKYEQNSFNYLRDVFERRNRQKQYAYFFHLSDLHFGNKIAEKRLMRIIRILETQVNKLEESAKLIPLITGDLMQSPSEPNKQTYLQFVELLISKGFERPIHILGNHDVDSGGFFKFFSKQKTIISSLSNNSKIELYEELKLGVIKFDSNTGGQLAQGKVGQDQLMQIGNEIDSIKNKDSYTFIALLHHHPLEIENPDWYCEDWYEAFLGTVNFERTMKLIDSELFLKWIKGRGIKFVLHGHKHIPKMQKHEDINIIGAGSTSGSVQHQEEGKTYLTYNLIKYDIENRKPVSCSIIAEEIIGAGTKNMLLNLF